MSDSSNRIIRHALMLLVALMICPACEKIEVGEPFNCKVGTKYLIENQVVFTIDSISDYRCPKDVVCIWAGDVDLYFDININLVRTDTLIRLYRNNPVEIGNYTWKVLEVNPSLNHNQAIDQGDYRIKLLIEKN
jgi:hypothetical protein